MTEKHCRPCEGGAAPLDSSQARDLLEDVEGWKLEEGSISREYTFENYYQTVSFVNAVAWIAHREDHHPDVTFGYKTCHIRYSTHAIGGLSENDFICAARINGLMA